MQQGKKKHCLRRASRLFLYSASIGPSESCGRRAEQEGFHCQGHSERTTQLRQRPAAADAAAEKKHRYLGRSRSAAAAWTAGDRRDCLSPPPRGGLRRHVPAHRLRRVRALLPPLPVERVRGLVKK